MIVLLRISCLFSKRTFVELSQSKRKESKLQLYLILLHFLWSLHPKGVCYDAHRKIETVQVTV